MDKLIQLQVRTVYGNKRYYPFNRQATLVCDMLNKRTLDDNVVRILREMGFTVEAVPTVDEV